MPIILGAAMAAPTFICRKKGLVSFFFPNLLSDYCICFVICLLHSKFSVANGHTCYRSYREGRISWIY